MFEELKKRVDFEINSVQFVERDGFKFIDIELPDSDLESIEKKSKIISEVLDEINPSESFYYLNIFSSGTEKEIKLKDINLFIGSYICIKSTKHYYEKNEWEGELIENNNDHVVIKVNNKGRIQNLKMEKPYIVYIKTTAKLRKEK